MSADEEPEEIGMARVELVDGATFRLGLFRRGILRGSRQCQSIGWHLLLRGGTGAQILPKLGPL